MNSRGEQEIAAVKMSELEEYARGDMNSSYSLMTGDGEEGNPEEANLHKARKDARKKEVEPLIDGSKDDVNMRPEEECVEKSNKNGKKSVKQFCQRFVEYLKGTGQTTHEEFDSLDYDICYNKPYKEQIRGYSNLTYHHIEFMRWVLVGVIGALTGLVAFVIVTVVHTLMDAKYSLFEKVLEKTMKSGTIALGLWVLLAFNVLFVFVSAIAVAFRPIAAGSGIPEIKCYLNGVKVPYVTRMGTLVAKVIGVMFSVAGGLLVGKEGPMIHSGAIIGAGLPQFRSILVKWFKLPYHYFRSDRDKRDFVSSGAAAGVAAAFGAPIGGVLFSLEEGASFWNQSLTWKTLFCSFSSTFTLNFLLSIYERRNIGFLATPGLVNFGVFNEENLWNAYHLIIFVLMGATGGLLGALFNSLNINLTKYRMRHLTKRSYHKIWRIVEVILIAMVTTFTVSVMAVFLGTCVLDTQAVQNSTSSNVGNSQYETRDIFCPGHGSHNKGGTAAYFNDMATLVLRSQEDGIKHLFHRNGAFTLSTLLIIFICYFFLACWTYGAGVPSGLFIPCLIIGATYGRFMATSFAYMARASPYYFGWLISLYPGTYALIGAASFLGGVVRMTISLTVILIETTNDIEYGLPIVITLMVAKWVGDIFNDGIYDAHIKLRKTPFLEWESPHHLDKLIAADVMNSSSKTLCYLNPISKVGDIVDLLYSTKHSAFLVVSPCEANVIPVESKIVHRSSRYGWQPPKIGQRRSISPSNWSNEPGNTFSLPSSKRQRTMSTTSTVLRQTHDEVLKDAEGNVMLFRGLIIRHQLTVLLKNKVFFHESEDSQKEIDLLTLNQEYPRYPDIASVHISEDERTMLMDLSVYMNSNPYTIYKDAPLPQVFTLFRTMGLRHLPVIEESGLVAGVITRHDLTHNKLHGLLHKKKEEKSMDEYETLTADKYRTL